MRAGEAASVADASFVAEARARPEVRPVRGEAARERLSEIAHLTTAATLAHERTLPVDSALRDLLPGGALRRGSNLAVNGTGATSFGLALVSEAARAGSFLAVVADGSFGLAACLDFGIPLRRMVRVEVGDSERRAEVIAALLDGFDLVLVADRVATHAGDARRLIARARERGSVLVRVGGSSWGQAADLRFDVGESRWAGLGEGHGHLRSRQLSVAVAGRRIGATRHHELLLPADGGGVQLVDPAEVAVATGAEFAPVTPLHEASGNAASESPSESLAARHAGADIDALLDAADAAAVRASQDRRRFDTGA